MTQVSRFHPITLAGIFAAATLALVLARAILTVDPYWDTLAYHWPYAARAAELCDLDCLRLPKALEDRYLGFPPLLHWLQGQIWRLTGTPGAGDLIGIAVLLSLCVYLRWRFCVPLAWSWLGFLAIPLVQVHATSSYVDLPANGALTIGILVLIRMISEPRLDHRVDICIALVALGLAAGGKLQLVPVAALIWLAILVVAVAHPTSVRFGSRGLIFAVLSIAGIVFLLPSVAYNIVRFGNPFYPMEVHFGPLHFLGPEAITYTGSVSAPWRSTPGPIRWLASVFEFDALGGRPVPWTIDQGDVSSDSRAFRMGGYYAGYVLALLTLLAWAARESRTTLRVAAAFMAITVTCAFLPLSHELRYYMFWMLALVSIVLAIAYAPSLSSSRPALMPAAVRATVAIALFTVIAMTGGRYLNWQSASLVELVEPTKATVNALPDGSTLCVLNRDRTAILYSRVLHGGTRHRVVQSEGEGGTECTVTIAPN